MFKSLYRIYGKLFNSGKRMIPECVHIGSNTIWDGMHIDVRNAKKGDINIRVGDDSIISGNFIIEKSTGYIKIGSRTFIGGGMFISIAGIEIGNDVMFSWGCTVIDNNAHSLDWNERRDDVKDWKRGVEEGKLGLYKNWENVKSGKITIKDKAWIGFNTIILKGVTVGEGAVVGAGSVVTQDVPDFCVIAGNPAKVIRTLK